MRDSTSHSPALACTEPCSVSSEAEDGFVLRTSRFVEHQFVSALNAVGEPVNEGHTQIKVVLILKS